ncbi:muellerian-inhibiting factor [Kryptolebias marmoratus]|uniref:Mullerian inhibitory substance n=1 Tax=Kryptolebias marmoratus TaxID=37003 RepID=E6Y5N7_KRYMA|nr:muellerian-inhibiting factor [Kryptolebias marmoratus]ACL00867.1 mullerian inhibitory substance [Kryptolebias marmoratus]
MYHVLFSSLVLMSEEEEQETITITFDLPQSPVLKLKPVLLLVFESPLTAGELGVAFSSQSLQPTIQVRVKTLLWGKKCYLWRAVLGKKTNKETPKAIKRADLSLWHLILTTSFLFQSACISEGTQYILLTAKPSEGDVEQKWTISVEPKSPDMSRTSFCFSFDCLVSRAALLTFPLITEQNLKDVFIGGKPGSSVRMAPLLLFSAGKGTDARLLLYFYVAAFDVEVCHAWSSVTSLSLCVRQTNGSSSASALPQTSFLCELRRFLDAVLPQDHPRPPLTRLDSLRSLPPLTLGPASSEILLAGIINSSAPTIFSFDSWGARFPVCFGRLALSPALLEELGQKLEESKMQMMELVKEKRVPQRAAEKLERLKELGAFQRMEAAADGESQYCAFLLLKALQTVAHTYTMQRRLRATRADSSSPPRAYICGLRSLTVSFEDLFLSPKNADINNCQGSCAFPLTSGNNHAVLLNSHIEGGHAGERAPCCVPVAYDPMHVIDWNNEGSVLSLKQNMIATECGCR